MVKREEKESVKILQSSEKHAVRVSSLDLHLYFFILSHLLRYCSNGFKEKVKRSLLKIHPCLIPDLIFIFFVLWPFTIMVEDALKYSDFTKLIKDGWKPNFSQIVPKVAAKLFLKLSYQVNIPPPQCIIHLCICRT